MSTTQTKNEAITAYLKQATRVHGLGSCILLPEFVEDGNGGWKPEGDGVRSTKKDGTSFIRIGSVVLGDNLKTNTMFTNSFLPTQDLVDTLDMLCIAAGGKVPGKLVIHERLEPFRRTNASEDIKWADKDANIACTVDDQPIYRRIEHTTNMSKEDIRVQHTNGAVISENARAKWAANNVTSLKANTNAIQQAAQKQQRLDELKAIPKTQRTAAQKAELAELMED